MLIRSIHTVNVNFIFTWHSMSSICSPNIYLKRCGTMLTVQIPFSFTKNESKNRIPGERKEFISREKRNKLHSLCWCCLSRKSNRYHEWFTTKRRHWISSFGAAAFSWNLSFFLSSTRHIIINVFVCWKILRIHQICLVWINICSAYKIENFYCIFIGLYRVVYFGLVSLMYPNIICIDILEHIAMNMM